MKLIKLFIRCLLGFYVAVCSLPLLVLLFFAALCGGSKGPDKLKAWLYELEKEEES
jgi:hypothetical protein